ncbi:GNAT family N-acetyltransferase [Thermoanaerobacterium sp. RBIITD]|uniref:GNAT family N-acetyltransferase n=1 Tax=Thermoanaerobacterium sp. RBIITD TaxID=1550240 RepID=UPI000BB8DC6D|nr:GNAT family N-acetyltransferase [Thermoanaerobacterium sp. RBIITD]SNX53661.1 L-amino acid N-acyltransferase YncA [Thermoanaerobacterium sp. RBIITD]
MRIREAKIDDVSGVAKVHVGSWNTTYKGIIPDEFLEKMSYEKRKVLWQKILGESGNKEYVYVLEDENEIIGFASCGAERSGDELYKGELYAIYLLKEYQRNGYGTKLFKTILNKINELGYSTILLWVLEKNPACQFYETMGGKKVKQRVVNIGGRDLKEIAYGWDNIQIII